MKTSIFLCCLLCSLLHIVASDVTYSVFNGIHGDEFECGSNVTVQCKFSSAPAAFTWKIAKDALTSTTAYATCFGGSCIKSSAAPDNYIFTYDPATLTSNVTIESVDFNEDGLQFFCDALSSKTLLTSSVIEIPSESGTTVSTKTDGTEIIIRMETNCVFPVDSSSFNLTWVRMKDEHKASLENITSNLQICSNYTWCAANGSSKIVSELNIPALDAGDQWNIQVKVKFQNFDEYTVNVWGYFYFSDTSQDAVNATTNV